MTNILASKLELQYDYDLHEKNCIKCQHVLPVPEENENKISHYCKFLKKKIYNLKLEEYVIPDPVNAFCPYFEKNIEKDT